MDSSQEDEGPPAAPLIKEEELSRSSRHEEAEGEISSYMELR